MRKIFFWPVESIEMICYTNSKREVKHIFPRRIWPLEMVEKALEPFHGELRRLLDLKTHEEAKLYCMGVMKGLYLYEEESESEFKDWATDIPGECFGGVLRKWAKGRNDADKKEMRAFIEEKCSGWAKGAMGQL